MELTVKQRMSQVFKTSLEPLGWREAVVTNSGLFCKNGCVLVLYNFRENLQESRVGSGKVGTVFLEYPSVTGASWHVEKNGWLIDSGTLSQGFLDIAEFGDGASAFDKFKELVEKINRYSEMTEVQLATFKTGLVTTFEEQVGTIVKPGEYSALKTGVFFTRETGVLGGRVMPGFVYKIVDLMGRIGAFRAMDKTLTQYVSDTVVIKLDDLAELEKAGKVKGVQLGQGQKRVPVRKMQSAVQGDAVKLPDVIEKFVTSGGQAVAIGQALASHLNYTPLLVGGMDNSVYEVMLRLLQLDDSCGQWLTRWRGESAESLNALEPFVRSGYSIRNFVDTEYTPEYLNLQYSDLQQGLDELASMLAQQGYSKDAINYVRERKTHGGISHLTEKNSVLILGLQDFKYHRSFQHTCDYFFESAISVQRDLLKAGWQQAPSEVKAEFRKVLLTRNFYWQDNPWVESAQVLLDNAMYVCFHVKKGFLLRCPQMYVGFDYNSIVAYDLLLRPVWRAVCVNEEVITDEAEICFG